MAGGTVGAPFGTPSFSRRCRADKKVIGIQGRSGLVLDQISLVCQ